MQQYSASCPQCSFVLQFYDASLFGRKGRCPKCRNKFLLHKPGADEPKPLEVPLKLSPAALKQKASPTKKSTVTAAQKPLAAAPAEKEQPWEMNMNRGLGIRRPTLPPRWIFPNVFAVSTLLVTAVGAATGMGAASWLVTNCPVSLLVAAAAAGGTIAVCLRVRKYDPLR